MEAMAGMAVMGHSNILSNSAGVYMKRREPAEDVREKTNLGWNLYEIDANNSHELKGELSYQASKRTNIPVNASNSNMT